MSDYPDSAISTIRRQLEMVQEFSDDLVDELRECRTKEEIRAVDGLDEADADTLVRVNGQEDLGRLFGMDERDAEILLEMSDEIQLLGEAKYSTQRHEFHLRRNFNIAKAVGGLVDALEDKDAAEEIVQWINTEQAGSAETNKDYRTAFRVFAGLVTAGDVDDKPDTVDWVPGGYPRNYDPAPQPEKMFWWEDHILPMLDACHNSRDRALIALAWGLGPRPSELYDLTRGKISDHKYGKQVTLYQGKQGTRSPVIVPSIPYVQDWLQDHPSDDPQAPLWTRKNRNDEISNQRMRDIFKEVAERADMQPPSTPTPRRMRKSSASYLASQGDVSQAHLEEHHGWTRGSEQAARYIAVFGEANRREIARAHGVEIDDVDEPENHAPITCPRCDRETPRERDVCMWCDQALSKGAVQRIQEQTRETRADLLRIAQDHPELLAEIESVEEIVRLVDDRPETLEEARALLEATGAAD